MYYKDLSNQKFGKLTVVSKMESQNGRVQWYCKCDCGGSKIVSSKDLLSGHTKSCGCISNKPKNISKDLLVELYVTKQLTLKQICDETGIKSPITLAKYMDKYNIPRRDPNAMQKDVTMQGMSDEDFKKFLISLYSQKSLNQIARELGITSAALRKYFIKYKIPLLGHIESNRKYNSGHNGSNWKGGRRLTTEGYVKLYMPDHPHSIAGAVYEHRFVMEQHIGRLLTKDEIVHHVNGNKSDNRIENLLLLSQEEHSKLHSELRKKVMPDE